MEMIGYVRDGVMGKMWTEDEETGEESINLEMMEPFKVCFFLFLCMFGFKRVKPF